MAPANRAHRARGVGFRPRSPKRSRVSGGCDVGDMQDRRGGSLIGNSRAARRFDVLADRRTSLPTTDTGGAISSPGSGFEPQAEALP